LLGLKSGKNFTFKGGLQLHTC